MSIPAFFDSPEVYSVRELNRTVSIVLSEGFPTLKVIGEVSNFVCPSSGHWYFSLKDNSAQVRCVFFQAKQRASHINLKDGMQVIVTANLRLYEIRGDFQLIIQEIETVGDGILQKQFEALKLKLNQEGLFDVAHKKVLPSFMHTVGLITSPTGAAIRDVLAVLKRRFPALSVIIYPTLVQGEGAASQIAHQIKIANQRNECQVLLLARGGGSLEDLWPFNEEIVARAIAASRLPIVSAIGHEIDITIADFVADIRAPTPSVAAELMSPDQITLQNQLQALENKLFTLIKNWLVTYQQELLTLKRCLRHPKQYLQTLWQQLDDDERRLQISIHQILEIQNQNLLHLARQLETLNPLAILLRGYAVVKKKKNNAIIKEASTVEIGENIIVQLAHSQLECEVKKQYFNE